MVCLPTGNRKKVLNLSKSLRKRQRIFFFFKLTFFVILNKCRHMSRLTVMHSWIYVESEVNILCSNYCVHLLQTPEHLLWNSREKWIYFFVFVGMNCCGGVFSMSVKVMHFRWKHHSFRSTYFLVEKADVCHHGNQTISVLKDLATQTGSF